MSEHTPTPWRNLNLFSVSVPKGTGLGSLAGDEMLALACVNAFHDPAGRKIATEDIAPELFWRMYDALRHMTHGLPDLLESIGYQDEEGLIEEARALLSSIRVQRPV